MAAQTGLASRMIGTWNTKRVPLSEIEAIRDQLVQLRDESRLLPDGTTEIRQVNRALFLGLRLATRAYDSFVEGIRTRRFALIERGDRLFIRAQSEFLRSKTALDEIVGSNSAFEDELSELMARYHAAASLEADRGMKASVDTVDALKKQNVPLARDLAEEAQSHFEHVVERLEAIPPPEDEDLQTFLRQSIHGFRLLAKAEGDYAWGIDTRDLASFKAGDEELRQGFLLVNEAAGDLVSRVQDRID